MPVSSGILSDAEMQTAESLFDAAYTRMLTPAEAAQAEEILNKVFLGGEKKFLIFILEIYKIYYNF